MEQLILNQVLSTVRPSEKWIWRNTLMRIQIVHISYRLERGDRQRQGSGVGSIVLDVSSHSPHCLIPDSCHVSCVLTSRSTIKFPMGTLPMTIAVSPRNIFCPKCNPEPAADCETPFGDNLEVVHLERIEAALAMDQKAN
jgi:hypothetical protein